jgi:hypothetical protein
VVKRLRGWGVFVVLLSVGCAGHPPPPRRRYGRPASRRSSTTSRWRGQTLGAITKWYTEKFDNWKKLTKPSADLELLLQLRVGRGRDPSRLWCAIRCRSRNRVSGETRRWRARRSERRPRRPGPGRRPSRKRRPSSPKPGHGAGFLDDRFRERIER